MILNPFVFRLRYNVLSGARLAAALPFLLLSSASAQYALGQASNALAPRPPMGWNDWAHYRCGFTAQTILDNAKMLVATGLSARGYKTVTIDDCWMQKERDKDGNLQADPQRFPEGIKPVADAVHALGLKFGIYEDAGFKTCGGFEGSGIPDGGGKDHFAQDARLFASWGVDYLKLDGCNMYIANAADGAAAYQAAYAAESEALKSTGRPIVFSESAPAYFLNGPAWYDVLKWVREYGSLWREGWDIATFKPETPGLSRFHSVLWNYAYNLPLGRFQRPGNWNDPDFLIGGDYGMTLPESRSQLALWAMMSAPLILSSDVTRLSPEAIVILSNTRIIAIDQDAQGKVATLLRRTPEMDLLFKPLSDGSYAVALLNRGTAPANINVGSAELGFSSDKGCRLDVENLWTGDRQTEVSLLHNEIASHDTAIWRVLPSSACGRPKRIGAITTIIENSQHDIDSYSRCLSASQSVGHCTGSQEEIWTITPAGALMSGRRCLGSADGVVAMRRCSATAAEHWHYTLAGNLVNAANHQCLSASDLNGKPQSLSLATCGHNVPSQIWSLPNTMEGGAAQSGSLGEN